MIFPGMTIIMRKLSDKCRLRCIIFNIKHRKKRIFLSKNTRPFLKYRATAPKELALIRPSQFDSSAVFVNEIWECARRRGRVYLDLSNLESLSPCGMIYFLSTLDQIVEKYKVVISGCYPKTDIVEQMLQKLGIIKAMGLSERKKIDNTDVTNWHIHRGYDVNFSEEYDDIEEILKDNLTKEGFEIVNSGISEAVSNTCFHGYEQNEKQRPWWAFVRRFESDKGTSLMVVLSDLGFGIHKTIPLSVKKKLGMSMKRFSSEFGILKPNQASSKIKIACELGSTRTKLGHRGKGLPEIVDVTRSLPKSNLAVISGQGLVVFRKDKNGKITDSQVESKTKIKGSVIIWQIPIPE